MVRVPIPPKAGPGYLFSMRNARHTDKSESNHSISTLRKHVYFYALLLLGTIVTHNVWSSMQPPLAPSETEQSMAQLKQTADTADQFGH